MREDNNDKRELLKYKQGLISKEECEEIEINKPPIYEKPTGFAAVQNFFYHYKLHLSFAAFFVVVGVILAYFTLTRDNPDIKILLIGNTQEASAFFFAEQSAIKTAFEQYTPDFNNDGKVYAACFFIDLVTEGRRPDYVQGNHTKLFGEVLGEPQKSLSATEKPSKISQNPQMLSSRTFTRTISRLRAHCWKNLSNFTEWTSPMTCWWYFARTPMKIHLPCGR